MVDYRAPDLIDGRVEDLAIRGEQTATRNARRLVSIAGGSIGNLIEWYDWSVYSAFSLYFAKSFFPSGDPTLELLDAAAVFAVGFLMRPVGGLLMGYYADFFGRKRALTASILLMSLGSFIIAVVPTYHEIGILSPITLIIARLLQGISIGGEFGTSATYLSEMSTQKTRGFYSSFQYMTIIMGQLLALLVLVLLQKVFLSEKEIYEWGWRIPFFIGAAASIFALWLRSGLDETDSFTASKRSPRTKGSLTHLWEYKRSLVVVVGLTMGGTMAFYTYTVYMQKFLSNTAGFTKDNSAIIFSASLFVCMLMHPIMGMISDRVGRRPMLFVFSLGGMFGSVPVLTAISHTHDMVPAFLLIVMALVVVTAYTSINSLVKAELFPVEIRALGIGLPHALTASIFGGTSEYVALLLKKNQMETWFYWYVSAAFFISFLAACFMPETKRTSLIDQDQH